MCSLVRLHEPDWDDLALHLGRANAENGVGGHWYMAPQTDETLRAAYHPQAWDSPVDVPGWQRVWGWVESERIVAHVVVTGGGAPSVMHRCGLSMHVEAAWRGRGIGRRLMEAAFAWARLRPSLEYVDGQAFAGNAPVLALDESVGFERLGVVEDVMRAPDGGRHDVVVMVARLRS